MKNVPPLPQRSITRQDQALRPADLWLFAKGFRSAHGAQSKKLYSVQRKVSKHPKIKGPAAFQPNGLKIMHGGGGGVSPSGKIPLYLSNMGALPSTPTEGGIIHCVFLNFCVILNSIPRDFVVEETPGLEQGSCRKTLGPQFSKHKYPLVKIHVSVMGGFFHLQDWAGFFHLLQAGMTGMLWMGYLAGNSHTDRCHTLSPAPTNWVKPHLPTQLQSFHGPTADIAFSKEKSGLSII